MITRCTPRRASRSSVGRARRRDEERVRVATRRGAGLPGDVEQAGQRRAGRRVDAVAEAAGQLGHLRPEAADDHRRGRRGSQEAADTPGRARPHLAQRGDRRLDRRPPRDVAVDRAPERQLLGGVGRARAAAGADAEQQPAAADLLQRRRHHGERAGVAVGDVEHERPDRQLRHRRGERAEDGPALEDVRGTVRRAGEVVVEPHAVEAGLLGDARRRRGGPPTARRTGRTAGPPARRRPYRRSGVGPHELEHGGPVGP